MTTYIWSGTQRHVFMGALILALALGTMASLFTVDKLHSQASRKAELSYLPSGKYLKLAVVGYRHIVADLLWLKAIQNFGGREVTTEEYRIAYHVTDVLTDLDPQFVHAFQFTGTILGVSAGLINESNAILSKGMEHNPTVWELPFYLGYNYYYELHDAAMGARYLRTAAALPKAPVWLSGLATRMAVEAGDPATALEFLQRLYLQTKDEQLKKGLAQRIRAVIAERDIQVLERAIVAYRERFGKMPDTLESLVGAGIVPQIPQEPFGGRYELIRADGSVKSPGLRERLRVYNKK